MNMTRLLLLAALAMGGSMQLAAQPRVAQSWYWPDDWCDCVSACLRLMSACWLVGLVLDVVACKTWVPQAVASLLLGGGPRGPKVDVSLLVIGARSWHV